MNNLIFAAATAVGCIVIAWIASTFLGTDNLALAVTAAIGFAYALGLWELIGYRRNTAALGAVVDDDQAGSDLPTWLQPLPAALRGPVQRYIEGRGVALPLPVLTPYLVGLLVMLGLLGTFIGMVDTLSGAVGALRSGTDLEAIRSALAAPIAGLGVAFGTSVAGIAASATLGLNGTLARRERAQLHTRLDELGNQRFAAYNLHHQRQLAFSALTEQAAALPTVATQLSDLAEQLSTQSEQLNRQLGDNQQSLQQALTAQLQELITQLSSSQSAVNTASQESFSNLAKQLGSEQQSLQQTLTGEVSRLLDQVGQSQTEATTQNQADLTSLAAQLGENQQTLQRELKQQWEALGVQLQQQQQTSAEASNTHHQQISDQLLARSETLHQQLRDDSNQLSTQLREINADHLSQLSEQFLAGINPAVAQSCATVEQQSLATQEQLRQYSTDTQEMLSAQAKDISTAVQTLASSVQESLEAQAQTVAGELRELSVEQLKASAVEANNLLTQLGDNVEQANDQRLAQWTDALEQLQLKAGDNLAQASTAFAAELDKLRSAEQQREQATIAALEQLQSSAADNLSQLGQGLEAPLTRLIETASETPQAAAEVIGKLREEISNNIARDNQLLEERQQLLQQMGELADSIRGESGEQLQAIQEMVSSAQASLNDSGLQFADEVSQQSATLREISGNFADGAAQIDGLGRQFSEAAQVFDESNDKLGEHLEQLHQALVNTTERSDEQMAYYVGQAREIIDQSMLAQRGVIEELRQLGAAQDLLPAEGE